MSMQATRLPHEDAASGTFETDKKPAADAIVEAHRLACEIEQLLTHRGDDAEPYGMRLARALSQSLIDQLADLSRDKKRSKLA